MASISSLGIGSDGLLSSDLIDDLVAAEREPTERRLDAQQELTEARISEYGRIRSAVSSLQTASEALSLPSTFRRNTSESSNSTAVTATVSNIASPGQFEVEVSQLARAQSIASGRYDDITDAVGTGKEDWL